MDMYCSVIIYMYLYIESYSNSHFIAEKAFFDPSLLELLYFPEDQKYVSDLVSSSWQAQKTPKKVYLMQTDQI